MLHFLTVTVSNDDEDYKKYKSLREYACDKVNKELSETDRIINVTEQLSSRSAYDPKEDFLYKYNELQLIVYYDRK